MSTKSDPVPGGLYDAAVRVLGRVADASDAALLNRIAALNGATPGEIALRLVEQALAGGVARECAR